MTTIDLIVAFTPAAAAKRPDVAAAAQLSITQANAAFDRSGVAIRLRLLDVVTATGYDDLAAGSYEKVLEDAANAVGGFALVHSRRDQLGADLVSVMTVRKEWGGMGYMPLDPNASTARYGFSVVTVDWMNVDDLFAHELGHNMGLDHDRYVVSGGEAQRYNYGVTDPIRRFVTVMGYWNKCDEAGIYCPKIGLFSNPNLTVRGGPAGIPAGVPGAADNSRRLNETRFGVAAYRPTFVPDAHAASMHSSANGLSMFRH